MDFAPNPDLEDLYRRVIADPASASRADRNAVFRLPPPDEEDHLCIAKTGLTIAELKLKTLTEPEKMTLDETKILSSAWGVLNGQWEALGSEECQNRLRREAEDTSSLKTLADEAEMKLLSVETQDETDATVNATKRDS